MNINVNKDIITALATPYGRSAIAAIRISGDECIQLVSRYLAHPLKVGVLAYNEFNGIDFKERLMAVCYKAPKSYTGEDTVELYPHGNMVICDGIIKTLLKGGARLAERGEFTKRAFYNGKLDLMKCEALADIIDAQTDEQLVYGNKRYDNGFKALGDVEKLLSNALSTVEAILHYSDELEENEIDEGLTKDVQAAIDESLKKLKGEIDGYAGGRIINDGFKVAIIGVPNVGKSTLLNALTDSDRAIVTDIAGTTRDTVEGEYVFKGKKFVITDTAGISETDDKVEKIGVERAKNAAEHADAVIKVTVDGGKTVEINAHSPVIDIVNKCDGQADVGEDYSKCGEVLKISAKNGINIAALKNKIYDLCPKTVSGICNHRQYVCVLKCYDACLSAKTESERAGGLEIVAACLYEAFSAIEELYGQKADEKVISQVFERFCVGK